MSEILSEIKKDQIYNLIKKGKRIDGRALDQYRKIEIETGVIKRAEGSAKVKLGATQVLVGVKLQPGEPYSDSPRSGVIITNVELVPVASPLFEPGPPDENATEIARVVDRGVRESGAIDLEKLYIEENKVWIIFIDVHVLDDDGNILDASSIGAIAALLTSLVPKKRFELGDDQPLDVRDVPIAITAIQFDSEIILDPSIDEEKIASAKLTVISNKNGSLVGLQKSGAGMLPKENVKKIIEIGIEKGKEIRDHHFSKWL
jgi:exosome complex component RRP42